MLLNSLHDDIQYDVQKTTRQRLAFVIPLIPPRVFREGLLSVRLLSSFPSQNNGKVKISLFFSFFQKKKYCLLKMHKLHANLKFLYRIIGYVYGLIWRSLGIPKHQLVKLVCHSCEEMGCSF